MEVSHLEPPYRGKSLETMDRSAVISVADSLSNPSTRPASDFRPAFEKLYHACSSPLRRVALSRVGNFHDAEDAVQEAFLKAYRNVSSFAGEATLSTWLYRILINVCRDFARRQRRRGEHQTPGADSKLAPQLVIEDHPLRLSVEKVLRQLNPRYSSVLLMFEVEGRKHSEIAALLRINEGTSKTRLSQARRQLKAMLSKPRRKSSR